MSAPSTPMSRATTGASAGMEYAAMVASVCIAMVASSGQSGKAVGTGAGSVVRSAISGSFPAPGCAADHLLASRREIAAVDVVDEPLT